MDVEIETNLNDNNVTSHERELYSIQRKPSALSISSNASSDETIIRRGRSSVMIIDESDDEEMYYIFNNRDVTYTTLVNPSPATSVILTGEDDEIVRYQEEHPPNLTELGMIHWNQDKDLIPDWRNFPKQKLKCQGLKNLVKMLNSPVGFSPPKSEKECKICLQMMSWTDNAGILLNRGAPTWSWGNQHNGDCLKVYSEKIKGKVDSGEICNNPRCSGLNPSFLWEKNQKSYCTIDCIDGYREWNAAASKKVRFLYTIYPTHFHPEMESMVGIFKE